MPRRTTPELVETVITLDVAGDSLEAYIDSATLIVDRIAALDVPPPEAEMEMVERWLSAHYYAVDKQRVAMEKAGPVSESRQYWVGAGFQTTMYGTQAMTLDSSGMLSQINAGIKRPQQVDTSEDVTEKRQVKLKFIGGC